MPRSSAAGASRGRRGGVIPPAIDRIVVNVIRVAVVSIVKGRVHVAEAKSEEGVAVTVVTIETHVMIEAGVMRVVPVPYVRIVEDRAVGEVM